MTQKEIAKSFLKNASSGRVEEAYQHVHNDMIHHNQYFKGDRDSLKSAMAEAHNGSPNNDFVVKYCYEDGNTVITHSLVEKDDMDIAVVHIFRFQGDKIMELWDLGQVIDKDSPNENGLF